MARINPPDIYRTPGVPLSQATTTDDRVYVSGQVPRTADGEMVAGDVGAQTAQVLTNLETVLEAAGATLENLLKLTVFLRDTGDLESFNAVYRDRIPEPFPARSVVEVSAFALDGMDLEVEAVAER